MIYSVLQTTHGKIIVAKDRMSALTTVLGDCQEIATLKGAVTLSFFFTLRTADWQV